MRNHPKQTLVLALFLLFVLFVPTQTHAGFFGWMKNVFSKDAENQTAQVIKTTRNRPIGMDGEARGHGKKFKVKDSHYADVVLESSTPITAEIKSIQNLIVIRTETADGQIVLSLSNLPKNTTYFKYIDSLRTAEEMKTDSAGFLTFNLNTSSPHIIFLQTKKSTRFINDDATGGNCTAIGIWTASTKTCNLNQDLTETIEIESDDITLDGNGHTLTGSNTGNGIFTNGRTGLVIKNITVNSFSNGIYITGGSGTKVQNVNVADSVDAIEMESHSGGLIENSSLSGSSGSLLSGGRGIELDGAINTVIIKNIMNGNEVGLRLIITAGSVVTQNTLQNNTEAGLRLVASNGETIYQNNFISNANQVTTALSPSGTSFNEPWPKGGNFWSDHSPCTPRTDNSNLCQEKYIIQSGLFLTTLEDNQPWVAQDKWESPDVITTPPPPPPTGGGGIWAEISSTTGTATLYTSADTTSVKLKILPNSWAIKVLDNTGSTFWKVEDVTDNTVGWMEKSSLNADATKQVEFEDRAMISLEDSIDERKEKILEAVKHYFTNTETEPSLYSGNSQNNLFSIFADNASITWEFMLGLIQEESKIIGYDNEWVVSDYGHGMMQITHPSLMGIGSKLTIPECESPNDRRVCYGPVSNVPVPDTNISWPKREYLDMKYYVNSSQSIYANIKDGIRTLQDKYNVKKATFDSMVDKIWYSQDNIEIHNLDMKLLLGVRGYNSFGLSDCPVYNTQNPGYLERIGDYLSQISTEFGIPYSDTRNLSQKFIFAGSNTTEARLCSPAYLVVVGQSTKTGYNGSTVVDQIPEVVYDFQNYEGAYIVFPQENYIFEVRGKEAGTYKFYVNKETNGGLKEFSAIDIPIVLNSIHRYVFDWQNNSVSVQVDQNNDGVYESIINSDLNITSSEFSTVLNEKKKAICHYPPGNTDNLRTLEIGKSAVRAHIAHGDILGECENSNKVKSQQKSNKK